MKLKRNVHDLLHRFFGIDVVRYDSRAFPDLRRRDELQRLDIGLVLDVGANTGYYAQQLRLAGFGGRIVSFEPLTDAFEGLERAARRDPLWETIRLALGAHDGECVIHIAGNSLSSSLLPMGARHLVGAPESREVAVDTVPLARLDSVRSEIVRGERTYLKLDVQGYELEVLHGAGETLPAVEAIECELSLVELYDGQPLLPEMVQFLEDAGYSLLLLEPEFRDVRSQAILQVSGIFVRSRR